MSLLVDIYDSSSSIKVRKKIISSCGQMGSKASVDFLIKVAKSEDDIELRKKAIFWLGQSNDAQAKKALLEIINQ